MSGDPEFGSFDEGSGEMPFPGVERRGLDSSHATVSKYVFGPGAEFPMHHHPQEQITLIEEGEVDVSIGGVPKHMGAGDWCVIPSEVEHSLTAGAEGAVITAIITPRRERTDAYTVVDD